MQRSDINPSMYRYMSTKYVDAFFDHGELYLPTFETFSRHPQEAFRDEAEGHSIFTLRGSETTIMGVLDFSKAAYVLCGSNLSPTDGGTRFGHRGCIQILDIKQFASHVAEKIDGCSGWRAGDCDYLDDAVLFALDVGAEIDIAAKAVREKYSEGFSSEVAAAANRLLQRNDSWGSSDGQYGAEDVRKLLGRLGTRFEEFLYRKRSQYVADRERRIVWLGSDVSYSDRVIEIPEARRFCRNLSNQLS